MSLFLLARCKHGVGHKFFICEDSAFITPVWPRFVFGKAELPTSSNTAYSLSGIGCFDKILPCPHKDGQEQRLSSASIKFLWLRQIHDPSGTSPALHNALSILLSCCWLHFFPVCVLSSFTQLLPVVMLSDSDSKQNAAATSFRILPQTFLVNVKKI